VKGDFSRVTFHADRRYAGVLMQQGRVQLDSDWNEQTVIVLEAVRAVARDLLGPHGGVDDGFRIGSLDGADGHPVPWDLSIAAGVYYVDGVRCENPAPNSYRALAEVGCDEQVPLEPGDYLAYLDVWDRHVTALEDPDLREVALGGPDTSTRMQVVWRVRLIRSGKAVGGSPEEVLADRFSRTRTPRLRARADPGTGYSGSENRLYRVEIHEGGPAKNATFVWSRDNGSIVGPVIAFDGDRLVVSQEPGSPLFAERMWVEPEDATTAAGGCVQPLLRIDAIEAGDRVRTSPSWPLTRDTEVRRWIRRWDHGDAGEAARHGAIPVTEEAWIDLEDGIQIAFDDAGDHRPGDTWLIPARPITRGIEWPAGSGGPVAAPPAAVEHHRAPLAEVTFGRDGRARVREDHRRLVRPLRDRP
jgi:hypothetical protein